MIRYPRGTAYLHDWKNEFKEVEIGKGYCLNQGTDIAVLSFGPIGNAAAEAIKMAEKQGLSVSHYDMVFAKPLDEKLLHTIMKKYDKLITIEDGVLKGGFGSAIIEFMVDNGYNCKVRRLGLPDNFVEHGTVAQLHKLCGIDTQAIYESLVKEW